MVEKDSYLLELSRYIHLNPWRVKKSQDPFRYRWSSLRAYVGAAAIPQWLTVQEVLAYFGSKGKNGYKEFISEGIKSGIKTPWDEVRGQALIGSEKFVTEMVEKYLRGREEKKAEIRGVREIVGLRPEAVLRQIEKYFGIKGEDIKRRSQRYTEPRYLTSYLLRKHCLLSLREIGERVGLHYSAVGNAIRQLRENPKGAMVRSLRELEAKFKNQ